MAPPPPPPAPKTQPKRATPAEKELDPAAKCQKIQQSLTAKTSRMVVKKKEEEERRRKEEKLRATRVRKVEERAAKHWDKVRLIQSCLVRSAYIPFTPEESDACATQTDIDACRVTIKEMIVSGRYSQDEYDIIRKTVNKRLPQFNSKMSESFNKKMKEMMKRTTEEIEARRADHPDACEIEKFISDDLMSEWMQCQEKFIKAY